jgi:hypothetical protein
MLPNKIQKDEESAFGAQQMNLELMCGGVVAINWNPHNRKVYLNYYNPDNANDNLGSRRALGSLFLKLSGRVILSLFN